VLRRENPDRRRFLVAGAATAAAAWLPSVAPGQAPETNQFLDVPGAKVTLPVSAAKQPFAVDFIKETRQQFSNFHLQMGGDHALYYLGHLNEFRPQCHSAPHAQYVPLQMAIDEKIGQLQLKTDKGEMTLDEYVEHKLFRLQGIMLLHKGKVVYQKFPGMNPTDRHIWASSTKTTVGLVVAMLAQEGKVDVSKPVTNYVTILKGTDWEEVSVIDVLNHTTAIDNEETGAAILDPKSVVVRFFSSIFGSPNPSTGKVEDWIDITRDMKRLKDEKPGERFRYSSVNTAVLTRLVEEVEKFPWAAVFEKRVWSQVGARLSANFMLAPDGTAAAFGLLSTTLEDFARYGLLFTPSWQKAAHERVVSPEVLKRIQDGGNPKSYAGSAKAKGALGVFNEEPQGQTYQFDFSFKGGALYKGGNLGQALYIDPARDFVGVAFSANPYVTPYGEFKAPAFMRAAAKLLGGAE
jgi:CubicO group peptidase (beta-lactamase class C family)